MQQELAPTPLLLLKIANRNSWKVFCSAHQSDPAPFSQSSQAVSPPSHPLNIFLHVAAEAQGVARALTDY
jgi:hypothetical protein